MPSKCCHEYVPSAPRHMGRTSRMGLATLAKDMSEGLFNVAQKNGLDPEQLMEMINTMVHNKAAEKRARNAQPAPYSLEGMAAMYNSFFAAHPTVFFEMDADAIGRPGSRKCMPDLDDLTGLSIFSSGLYSQPIPEVDKIFFNESKRITVVKWTDGTSTKVKCPEDITYSRVQAFNAALAKRMYTSNAQINTITKKLASLSDYAVFTQTLVDKIYGKEGKDALLAKINNAIDSSKPVKAKPVDESADNVDELPIPQTVKAEDECVDASRLVEI